MRVPVFISLRGYRRGWLRGDLLAALTVWAVLVPEALAYASIAGVPPVVGLYAAPGALLLYAALGSSRHLVTGPMSATAALSAATVADVVAPGAGSFAAMTAALAITTGLAALIAGALRLGFLASFISGPVLKGFIVGLALTIIIGQVPGLLGVDKGSGNFFEQARAVISELGDIQGATLLVGAVSLAAVIGLRRLAPVVPGSLVAVVLGIVLVKAFSLQHHGVAIVGTVPGGLPPVGAPDVSLNDYGSLVAGGIGVMLVGFAEGLGTAKTYARRGGYEVVPDRELLGLGGANVAAGLCGGMVVNGSLSKTAVNGAAGARTQLSGLIVAALVVLTLLLLTGLFGDLPKATLSAIVIAAVIELVDFPALRRLRHTYEGREGGPLLAVVSRPDWAAAVAAMAGVLVFDTLPGLFIGIAVSMLLLLYRASRPEVAELGKVPGTSGQYGDLARHPENRRANGVVVLRVEGPLFFANADTVRDRLRDAAAGARVLILDAETLPYIDVTATEMLEGLTEDLEREGVTVALAGGRKEIRDVVRGAAAGFGGAHLYPTVEAAVEALGEPG